MSYKLVISVAAESEMLGAKAWYETQRDGLAELLRRSIESSLLFISDYPEGCMIKYKDIRVKYLSKFPYGLHYEIRDDRIEVLGFYHVKRNPSKWEERLKDK